MSHLGGHVNQNHIELEALQFLIKTFNLKTMIDVGCSKGDMVGVGNSLGLDAYGIEGDANIVNQSVNKNKITIHDFTHQNQPKLPLDVFDLGYSTEVLEHIDEAYVDNILYVFSKCRYVLYTAAPPKWPGFHHVNCQEHEYWLKKFNQLGFILDPKLTKTCRDLSSMNATRPNRKRFIKHRAIFLRNTRLSPESAPLKLSTSKPSLESLYIGKFASLDVPEMAVIQPKVKDHVFKSSIPLTSFIGTVEEAKKSLHNVEII